MTQIEMTFRLDATRWTDDARFDAFVDRINHLVDPDAVIAVRHGVAYLNTGIVESESESASAAALRHASLIEEIGRAKIIDIDDDLVDITDVAFRAGVTHETARLWAAGKRRAAFPQPAGSTTETGARMWAWSDVHSWLTATTEFEDGVEPISTIDRARFRVQRSGPNYTIIASTMNEYFAHAQIAITGMTIPLAGRWLRTGLYAETHGSAENQQWELPKR